jgi:hypothetical protein
MLEMAFKSQNILTSGLIDIETMNRERESLSWNHYHTWLEVA